MFFFRKIFEHFLFNSFFCKQIRDCQIFYSTLPISKIETKNPFQIKLCVPLKAKWKRLPLSSVLMVSAVKRKKWGRGCHSYTVFVPLHPFLSSLEWKNDWRNINCGFWPEKLYLTFFPLCHTNHYPLTTDTVPPRSTGPHDQTSLPPFN